jgi:hypothetical protein
VGNLARQALAFPPGALAVMLPDVVIGQCEATDGGLGNYNGGARPAQGSLDETLGLARALNAITNRCVDCNYNLLRAKVEFVWNENGFLP